MNFADGVLLDEGDGPRFKNEVMSVRIPPPIDAEAPLVEAGAKPRPVVFGIRPEDLYDRLFVTEAPADADSCNFVIQFFNKNGTGTFLADDVTVEEK